MEVAMAAPTILHSPLYIYKTPSCQWKIGGTKSRVLASRSARSSLKTIAMGCKTCRGKGAIECAGCKGTGKNKKNGNIFERWKCYDCQGFGMKSCPSCGKGGLTPEQRGER
ncbi:hypothetical protein LUZ60_013447 [Juncus effusus]|nr:hypothetical protein LUZ60_013447 [Juncus effusus]